MKYRRLAISAVCGLIAASGCGDPQPEGPTAASLAKFEPTGLVEATRALRAKFPVPMVEQDQIGKFIEGEGLFSVTPHIEGRFVWRAVDTLELIPKEPFKQSTRYRVTLAPHPKLGGGAVFHFHTRMFTLRSIESFFEKPSPQAATTVRVNVEFTHPVRRAEAKTSISFQQDGRLVRAQLVTPQDAEVMAFELEPLEGLDHLSVRIEGTLTAKLGGVPIGKAVVRPLVEDDSKRLEVLEVRPDQEGSRFSMRVRFSSSVQQDDLIRAVSVEPKVDFRVEERYHGAVLVGDFAPRTEYRVQLAKGLISQTGEVLQEAYVRVLKTPDLAPRVRFKSSGIFLLRSGRRRVYVSTVNMERLLLEVHQVKENNLAHVAPYLNGRRAPSLRTLGRKVYEREIEVERLDNREVTTSISFDEFEVRNDRGLYLLTIRDANNTWKTDRKWLMATDLGVTVKLRPGYARAQVLSLKNMQPILGASVVFLSQTNQVLAKVATGPGGVALMETRTNPEDPLGMVMVKRSKDVAYLPLEGTRLSKSSFDVDGEGDSESPYEAYMFSDRGLYRPGESLKLSVLLRDRLLKTPPPFPYRLEVRDPAGRLFYSARLRSRVDGAKTLQIALPRESATGRYAARALSADGFTEFGRYAFSVEEFMPDRIEVKVKGQLMPKGQTAQFQVEGRYLFGPKAAGLRVDARCVYQEIAHRSQAWPGFVFAVHDEERLREVRPLEAAKLDAQGRLSKTCALDGKTKVQGPVRIRFHVTVFEPGGRSVSASTALITHQKSHYVALHRDGASGYAQLGKDVALEAMAIGPDDKPVVGVPLRAEIFEVVWRSILKLVDGRYKYVSEQVEVPVTTVEVASTSEPIPLPFVPEKPGRYRVALSGRGARSTYSFYVSGEGSASWSMARPGELAMTLDRAVYKAGQKAKVMVRAPFSGTLLLSLERDRVLWERRLVLSGNTSTIEIPVTEAMGPSSYITAQLVRSPGSLEHLAPMRAFGVVPIKVQSERHKLDVALEVPKEVRPGHRLAVQLRVRGQRRAAHAWF